MYHSMPIASQKPIQKSARSYARKTATILASALLLSAMALPASAQTADIHYDIEPAYDASRDLVPEMAVQQAEEWNDHGHLQQMAAGSNILFASGGIGKSEVAFMEQISPRYNTHLLFADHPSGAYLSDVTVQLIDKKDQSVILTETSDGPYFYMNLPEGRYRVKATYGGEEKQRDIRVRSKQASQKYGFTWRVAQ